MARSAFAVRPNPALTYGFANARTATGFGGGTMTLQGTVNKTFALTGLLIIGAALGWPTAKGGGGGLFMIALIAAAVISFVTVFKPTIARITAPIYALLEGFVLGAISELFNASYPGIVVTAVLLTFGILIGMLFIYRSGVIQVTQKFRVALTAATFAVFFTFLIGSIAAAFGGSIGFISGNSGIAIVFSLIVIVIAAANLLVDFDFIQRSVAQQAPSYMEWYGAFSIMITLVWLYIEILRVLSQFRSR